MIARKTLLDYTTLLPPNDYKKWQDKCEYFKRKYGNKRKRKPRL